MAEEQSQPGPETPLPDWYNHPDVPRTLRDMAWVYHRPKGPNETLGMRTARKVLDKDPLKFLQQMHKMEADLQAHFTREAEIFHQLERQKALDEQAAAEKAEAERRAKAEKKADKKAEAAVVLDAGSSAAAGYIGKLLADRPWEGKS